jgi:hypothetical protein
MLIPQILVAVSAAIVGLLGAGHLVLTFWGPKLLPRDRSLRGAMERTELVITKQTTVWRAWIGFNASHSMGALLFGLVYSYLAVAHDELLFQSFFLQAVGLSMLITYVVLAKLYWFITPFLGTSVALACFLAGVVVAWGR